MDATLTEEQRQIQESVEEYIESKGGTELARRALDGERDVVNDLWNDLADLGYTSMTVPGDFGGLDEGPELLVTFLEVAGRYALPGPIPETLGFAVPVLSLLGDTTQRERYLPGIADGDYRFTFAVYDDPRGDFPAACQMEANINDNDEFRLDGTKTLVPHAGDVDFVIVATRTQTGTGLDGISVFVVDVTDDTIAVDKTPSLDETRPMYDLAFDGTSLTRDHLLGPLHGGGSALDAAIDRFTVGICAMLVGAADRAVDRSAEYASVRKQYGQPIGRFQAVKHRIVDMWVDVQSARSLLYYAAWALETDSPDAPRAVATANAFIVDRLHRVIADDVLTHGATGFTWDHDAHISLKQAKAWRNFLGSPETNRERLIETRLAELNGPES